MDTSLIYCLSYHTKIFSRRVKSLVGYEDETHVPREERKSSQMPYLATTCKDSTGDGAQKNIGGM